jgi:hypothetical protein
MFSLTFVMNFKNFKLIQSLLSCYNKDIPLSVWIKISLTTYHLLLFCEKFNKLWNDSCVNKDSQKSHLSHIQFKRLHFPMLKS